MLVLARDVGESVRIGDDIIVHVVTSSSGKLRIGITAPKDIPIHREEIYAAIKDGKGSDHANRTSN